MMPFICSYRNKKRAYGHIPILGYSLSWRWHFGVGREVWGMAALELDVVEFMAKHTAARHEGLVGMIRGSANPKSGGARRRVHSQPPTLSK
jgi:hypothetical protein